MAYIDIWIYHSVMNGANFCVPVHVGDIIYTYVDISQKSLLQNIVSFIGLFCKRDL